MSIPGRSFDDWLTQVGLPSGVSELSSRLGIKRTTLQNQRLRGAFTVQTAISAARVAKLNPLDVLSGFAQYAGLNDHRQAVTKAELLSQVSYVDALAHLLARIKAEYARKFADMEMGPIPADDSVRKWIDAIDPGGLRRQVSEVAGIKPSNLSAQLSENRLTPELGILAAGLAGVSSANGLVVTGLVTPAEAGWPPYGRENAISEIGDVELIDLVSERLTGLRRQTKKKEEAAKAVQDYLEALG